MPTGGVLIREPSGFHHNGASLLRVIIPGRPAHINGYTAGYLGQGLTHPKVDADTKPLVVYHGTRVGGFNVLAQLKTAPITLPTRVTQRSASNRLFSY
jgi:hypothetical protein